MRAHRLMVVIVLLLSTSVLHAQDATPTPGAADLTYGLSASGTLDDQNPRLVFSFDGLRGEFISLDLQPTSGTLDPVLLVIDSQGDVLARRDDSGGTRGIRIDSLRIPHNDRYLVVVGRFGYSLGMTSGAFELQLQRLGASFDDGSGLRYGDTVLNQITDMNPRIYYTFRAERGDILTVRMERTSGNLDASLQLVDTNGVVLAENDEIEGSGSLDAAIVGYIVEQAGTYVIIATRYGQVAGRSSGSFVLTLNSGVSGGLGRNVDFPIPLISDQVYEGELTEARYEQFYRFEGQQFDLVSIEMSRVGGALDPFLTLTDDQQNPITSDDDGGGAQNAAIRRFALPYSGVFYIIATRFQGEQGTTVGTYSLTLRNEGSAFDDIPGEIGRMTYGSTANGTLDDLVPRLLLAFYGVQGDTIRISMNRTGGDLDSVVALLDSNQQLLTADDDSGGAQNALIDRYVLPATGVYFIQAGRYEGGDRPITRGSFVLVLAQRFDVEGG